MARRLLTIWAGATALVLYASASASAATVSPIHVPSTTDRIVSSPYSVAGVAVVVVGLLVFPIFTLLARRAEPLVARVGGFVSLTDAAPPPLVPEQGEAGKGGPATPSRGHSLIALAEQATRPEGLLDRLAATLELADFDATALQVVLITLVGIGAAGLILNAVVGPFAFVIALVAVPLLARSLVLGKLRRRLKAFADQLPDNLDVLSSALRAGHSLVSGFDIVAEEASEPSKSEYKRVVAAEQLGAQFEDALKECATRMANRDLEQVSLVARLQREMGSNSAEVLDRLAETVKDRTELRRLAHTLTAQGRLSRWILTALPIALVLLLELVDPSYMHPLFHRDLGRAVLIIAACLVTLGSIMMGKLSEINP